MNGDPPNLETTDARQLYLGSLPKQSPQYAEGFVGVCLDPKHEREIQHDLASPLPLSDSVIEQIQAEDVLEHIDLDFVPSLLSEIWACPDAKGKIQALGSRLPVSPIKGAKRLRPTRQCHLRHVDGRKDQIRPRFRVHQCAISPWWSHPLVVSDI